MNILVIGKAKTGTTVISKTLHHSLVDAHYHLEPKRIRFFGREYPATESHVVKLLFDHWETRPHLRDAILFDETELKFDKKIAIIRDPRDELISRLFFIARNLAAQGAAQEKMERWIDFLRHKESNPQAVSVHEMMAELNRLFGTSVEPKPKLAMAYLKWIQGMGERVYVLKYEDFMQGKLDGLSRYLGMPLSDNRDVGELAYTQRSSDIFNWKRLFTEDDVSMLKPAYADLLDQAGYTDWELEPQTSLDPAIGSEYVRRITKAVFEQARQPGEAA